jgi:hypothetical protein
MSGSATDRDKESAPMDEHHVPNPELAQPPQ